MDYRSVNTLAGSLVALWAVLAWPVHAAEKHINEGDSFEEAVESLAPGDVLVVHAGTYADAGRISIQVKGTAAAPVVIQAAYGETRPHITRRPGDAAQNTINIEGATYVTIRGLEISSNGGDGINLNSTPSYITLEDLEIHDVEVGINFRSNMHHILVTKSHIHHTSGTGEGLYVGCNYAECVVSDSVITNNWIHDTLTAEQGDGIEIKRGSHSNVIRDNVIHDTNYPCVLVYGTEGNPRNVIERNVMWNCGDSGIQAAADALIRDNIILESPENGLSSQPHQGVSPGNLQIVHNTIVGGNPCLRFSGWSGTQGMVFANNAVYCESEYFLVGDLQGVDVAGNVFWPVASGFPGGGFIIGRGPVQDFVDPGQRNFYPTSDSAVRDAGADSYRTETDFNGTNRIDRADPGAYEWVGQSNPGWPVGPGFKQTDSPPEPPTNLRSD